MAANAQQIWNELSEPWQCAFDEAWAAWRAGSLGIGAALVDPATGEVVSAGRNRTAEERTEPGILAGNFMAHAEMNAFAVLDRFKADGLHLYTTLEPCLMCSGTAVFLHVEATFYAVADPYFENLHDLWDHHPYSARWKRPASGPVAPPMSQLSTILHLSRQSEKSFNVMAPHLSHEAALVKELDADETLDRLAAEDAGVVDVLAELLPRLLTT